MSTWSSAAFFLAVAVNLIVALFYPYMDGQFNAIGRWVRSVGWSLLSGDALEVSYPPLSESDSWVGYTLANE